MKLTIVTGKPGSGRTGYLMNSLKHDGDNFVVTTDSSVYYIERLMSERKFPGRCVGISSLAKSIYQEIGGITDDLITDEMQIVLLTDIMKSNYSKLSVLKIVGYKNSIVDDISVFINQCINQGITPKDLLDSIDSLWVGSRAKIKDIAFVYSEFLDLLKKKKLINNAIFNKRVVKVLKTSKFRYKSIFIDSLNRYSPITLELIEALVRASEECVVAFSTVSPKSYSYNIYQNSMNAYKKFDEFATSLEGCVINRVALKADNKSERGIDIIKNELFNRDTDTKAKTDDVFLHEASSIYKEVDFVASKIKELVEAGYKYDDIVITGTDMETYKNILSNMFSKNGIHSYYYKSKKVHQTTFYDFNKYVFDIVVNGLTVESLLSLVNINYFGLMQEDISIINTFFLRFGNDIDVALKNGEIYDNDNFVHVNLVINKIRGFINALKADLAKCAYYHEFTEVVYNFWVKLNLNDVFYEQYLDILTSSPQLANEIVETWNSFIKIIDSINKLDDGRVYNFKNFVDVFDKFCEETNIINLQEYCDEVRILDIKDVQNRKSKICFVIGCNEGKFPFSLPEGLISDSEVQQLNTRLGKTLPQISDRTADVYLSIYSTLTLPSDKLFLSWSANDTEARPMRYANILNNIVKTFSDNLIKEEKFYGNDKEEVFLDFLVNLAEYRKTGICPEELDNEYWELSSDPKYSERLTAAVNNAVIDKKKINSENATDLYIEKDFFGVTRIERFSQCPFKHYMEYALSPEEQKVFEEKASDKGSLYHSILLDVFDYIKDNVIDIKALDYETFKEFAEKIIKKDIASHNENMLESNITLAVEKDKMARKILKTAWNAILQLNSGDFEVFKTELRVGKTIPFRITLDSGKVVNLIGVIDRVDKVNIGGEKYARIIDYKSGTVSFSEDKIALGLQLQLPLYMKLIMPSYKPAGMYYSRIVDPMKDIDSVVDFTGKKFQLNGPTLANLDVLVASDEVLDEGDRSNVIQAEVTKKGEISKRSKVLTADEFNELIEKAEGVAKKVIEAILSGETDANPLVIADYNACDYCPYKSICHIS